MSSSKSSLFLMEMLLTILFFSVAGAVCLQLYVKAHLIDENTTVLSHSDEWVQNLAETYYGCDADMNVISAIFKESNICPDSSGRVVIVFDSDWNRISNSNGASFAAYAACLEATKPTYYSMSNKMDNARISVWCLNSAVKHPFTDKKAVLSQITSKDSSIYSIELKHYDNTRKGE